MALPPSIGRPQNGFAPSATSSKNRSRFYKTCRDLKFESVLLRKAQFNFMQVKRLPLQPTRCLVMKAGFLLTTIGCRKSCERIKPFYWQMVPLNSKLKTLGRAKSTVE